MVIDYSVSDQPDCGISGDKRGSWRARIHHGEVVCSQPGFTNAFSPATVRSAVVHAVEHSLPQRLVKWSVSGDDGRHHDHFLGNSLINIKPRRTCLKRFACAQCFGNAIWASVPFPGAAHVFGPKKPVVHLL